jgi:hypothetical protein
MIEANGVKGYLPSIRFIEERSSCKGQARQGCEDDGLHGQKMNSEDLW